MATRQRSQTSAPTPSSDIVDEERTVIRHRSLSVPGLDIPIAVAITTPVRRSSLFAETSKSTTTTTVTGVPPLPPAYTSTPSHSRNFSVPTTSTHRNSVHHTRSNPNLLQSTSSYSINTSSTRSNPNLVSSFNNGNEQGSSSSSNNNNNNNRRSVTQEVAMVANAPPLTIPPRTLSHGPHLRTFSMHDIPADDDRVASSSPPPPYTAPSSTTHRARAFSLFSATSPTSPHSRNPCPHERTRGVVRVRDEESGVEYDVESGPGVRVVEGQGGVRTLISGRQMTMDEYKSARQRRKWYILACGTGVLVVLAVAISQLYGVWNGNNN